MTPITSSISPIVTVTIPKWKRTSVYKVSQLMECGVKGMQIARRIQRYAPDLMPLVMENKKDHPMSMRAANKEINKRIMAEIIRAVESDS